jgi:cell division cycle 14|tara:strand:- start:738 stop:1739 length:1002 start_codon:yes stop_codon:yes gene_type:complete
MFNQAIKTYYIINNIYLDIHIDENHTKNLISINKNIYYFSSDYHEDENYLGIENGPPNISIIYNFCNLLDSKVKHLNLNNRDIYYYIYIDDKSLYLLNAVFLISSYLIFKLNNNIQKLIRILSECEILNDHPTQYKDCVGYFGGYQSNLIDCLETLYFVKNKNYFILNKFNNKFYEYCNDLYYRDFNIILSKMIAMRSPKNNNELNNMIHILKKNNIKLLIRLNNDYTYNESLLSNNLDVSNLFFEDSKIPSINIIIKFIKLIDEYNEMIAIHCKAGLGRTGILICIWLIYKLNFKPEYAISWLRIYRPGSIHGYQGYFIKTLTKDYLISLIK